MIKKVVLITGANGGIGFELAAQLMAQSCHVLLGSRSVGKGQAAVKDLESRSLSGSVELLKLDVTNDDDIVNAAANVERQYGKLDGLVNNAGCLAPEPPIRHQMREAFDVNATGPAILVSFFAPLLQKSTSSPRIVNISSGAGSINRRLEPSEKGYQIREIQYRASKAALNMVTACQHVDYSPLGIKVFAYCPGFTQSNLSSGTTVENGAKPVDESVKPLIDILEGKRDDDAGKFLHASGIYPW